MNVVHGVPGALVDLCLTQDTTFEKIALGAVYRSVTTVQRMAGSYTLKVVPNGSDCNATGADSASANLTLVPGLHVSAVAALSADGSSFTLFQFMNDTSPLGLGRELGVRHLAVAPAVDFRYGAIFPRSRIRNLSYATAGSASPLARRLRTDLTAPGDGTRLFGPRTVVAPRGQSTIVNIVGSAEDGTLDFAVESVDRRGDGGLPGFDFQVDFAPTTPTPGPNSVAMSRGFALGNFLVIDVRVTDTTGIYAADFDVVFDPGLMSFLFSSPGMLLEQAGDPVQYNVQRIQAGRVSAEATRVGPIGTVNAMGTQTLLRLTFVVTAAGTSTVEFADMQLLDAASTPLAGITWSGGNLTATEN